MTNPTKEQVLAEIDNMITKLCDEMLMNALKKVIEFSIKYPGYVWSSEDQDYAKEKILEVFIAKSSWLTSDPILE